jgi:hypothetical protein
MGTKQKKKPNPGRKPKPYSEQPDKAAMSHNLSNEHGYESNGFKKHRDNTPI